MSLGAENRGRWRLLWRPTQILNLKGVGKKFVRRAKLTARFREADVCAPDRERHAGRFQCFSPRQELLIDAIQQRPVEVNKNAGRVFGAWCRFISLASGEASQPIGRGSHQGHASGDDVNWDTLHQLGEAPLPLKLFHKA